MSSRRGAGEDNILAMLERDSARRPGARMSGMRLASYGAAAALAGILAGGVAWLAYDNHKATQELQVRHDAPGAAPTVLADAALPPLPPPSPGASPAVEAPRAAVIVDESAHRPDGPAASSVPPLVMLPPHEAAGAKPTLPAPRLVREVAQPKPPKPEAKSGTRSEAPRPAPRLVAEKKADKPKPASRVAKAPPARAATPAKARAEASARPRKAARPAETAVDSDVALISAIISHAERHRGEHEPASAGSTAKTPPPKSARQ
jgi:hypothetical protein